MRSLVYYIGTSVDGFIADPDGGVEVFEPLPEGFLGYIAAVYPQTLPTHVHAHVGIASPAGRFGSVVMGRATYEPALAAGITSPYAHLEQYVVSSTLGPSPDPAVHVVDGDPLGLVRELKARQGTGDIWLAGGARLAGALLPEIDELVVKVYPFVLGSGIPMFAAPAARTDFRLTGSEAFGGGAAILTYTRA